MWHSENSPIITNIDIPGYTLYSTKSLSQNGGVGLYVKSPINSINRVDLNHQCYDFETIWIETEALNEKNLLFCCVYRHPNSAINLFTDHFIATLTKLNNKRVFVMGDFNVDLLNYDTHSPTKDFVNSFLSNQFLPCISHPTRISDCSSTIIDNIFTNIVDAQLICGNITTHISDHFPQFLILKNAKIPRLQTRTLKYDYSSINERNFLKDFNKLSLNYINDASDIDTNYDKFLSDLTLLVNKHVPSRMITKRELKFKSKPWINYRIQKMIKLRDRFLRRLAHNKSENNLLIYKKFRNRVANELKAARKKYFQNYFEENGKNMKKIWTGIKRILSSKNSIFSRIYKIKDKNGKLTSDAAEMSIILNEFFINVGNDISKSIQHNPKSPTEYLTNRNSDSIVLSPVTAVEVNEIILNLDSSKSIGPNSIPVKLLKILGPKISHPLATMINQSFSNGIFPSKLKIAKVVPIFKKGDPEISSNYRPISLLPIFSKIYEKLMHKRIYAFLKDCNILYPLQFGFQENNSIDHALISLTEEIRSSLDNRRYGCGIFLDLQKAFDTVNHGILLNKLEHYGIRGSVLDWFKSYLSERRQFVSINGSSSSLMTTTCGVPQGSVLGPLLFLIYVNDLPNVSKQLKFYLFADDTNIYCDGDTLTNLAKIVNKELKSVKRWLDVNRLSLNISKTNYIIFHSTTMKIPEDISIKIGRKHLTKAKYVKFLGLLLDENLSWKFHLSELSKKLARTCGIFFKIRSLLPINTLILVYNSLFLPFLQYGVIVWGQTFTSYLEPLILIQKKIVRAIAHQRPLSHTLPIFKSLKLLQLYDIFRIKLLCFVYESINKLNSYCFHEFFQLNSDVHGYFTRQSNRGDVFRNHKNSSQYGLRSIRYMGAKTWNELPEILKNSTSKFSFKKNLKKFIQNSM